MVSFRCWFGTEFLEKLFWRVCDVLGLFSEEQESEDSDQRKKTKKGTKRKRDGKSQEQGTMAHDLKLDDMLDRTLEDGAKQHNLTAVNVRNILHVSSRGQLCSQPRNFPLRRNKQTCKSPESCYTNWQFCWLSVTKCFTSKDSFLFALSTSEELNRC